MSSPEILERFLRGEELPLAVEQIENILAMLWHAVPAERNLTRVCEANLIIQMRSAALIDPTAAVLREFARRHSCRALMLVTNPDSEEEELSGSIAALLRDTNASTSTVGEQILLVAGGQSTERALELARTLVLEGVPTAFWFVQGIPPATPLLDRLMEKESRVIFDSATVEDLGVTLARANALLEKNKPTGDLNWQRLAPWLAQLEETLAAPEAANLAPSIEKISMSIGGEALDENQIGQPLLLLSWLAQRLGWELVETLDFAEGAFRGVWEKEGREIVAEIKNMTAATQGLYEFVARSAVSQTTLTITRVEDGAGHYLQTFLSRDGKNVLQQQAPAQVTPPAVELLLHEFERDGMDENYKETLSLATKLI